MKKGLTIQGFREWLNEAVETVDFSTKGASGVINYPSPKVIVKKRTADKIFNQIVLTTPSGKTIIYALSGIQASLTDPFPDINFKYIKKEEDNSLTFGRYVTGGVKDFSVPANDVKTLLSNLMHGPAKYSTKGLTFTKI
jgi:hypothetical protein